MIVRPFAFVAALLLAACTTEPTGTALQRSLAEGDVVVKVDSVGSAFGQSDMTFAHFSITNATTGDVRISSCIEGLGAALQRPGAGDAWDMIGGTMCWGTPPSQGLTLAAGQKLVGAIQVNAAGTHRVLIAYTDGGPADEVLLAASPSFVVP